MNEQTDKKNVLMICVDQWAASCMGFNGHPVVMTPTIDLLARGGVCFENTYSECPICIPARRSIMTGTAPRTHGDRIYNETLPMPKDTLAKSFVDAGYQAYAVGKLHVYPQRDRIGFNDVILMEEGRNEFGVMDDYQLWLGEQGHVCGEWLHAMGNNTYYTRPWHLEENTHPTTWATWQMMRTIQRRDPNKPGFFYISYQFPHPPLVPLQTYLDLYSLDEIDEPMCNDNWSKSGSFAMQNKTALASSYSEKEIKLAKRAYYAACTHIDHQIRLLIGTIREASLLDNTVIVLACDHGDMLFNHNMAGKTSFYEDSAHVPLIFSGKPVEEYKKKHGSDAGKKLANLADIMPTLLDFCEIPVPDTVEGISLFSAESHQTLYGEIGEKERATRMIFDGQYKLVYYPAGNVKQLFDLIADPKETKNLSAESDYTQICARLEKELIARLYKGDEKWAQKDSLCGIPEPALEQKTDFALFNQRGMHWPPPVQYQNAGNQSK